MQTLRFDLSQKHGAFKPLNAVNGGPRHRRRITNMHRSNIEDYTKARIPYTRNHDSGITPIYGGPYSIDDIYSLCGCDKEGKTIHVLTYYTENDNVTEEKTFTVDYGKKGEYEIYLLDAERDAELVKVTNDLIITIKPNTMVLIKEK